MIVGVVPAVIVGLEAVIVSGAGVTVKSPVAPVYVRV